MLKVAVGHSDDPDSKSAIAEIIDQCKTTLEGLPPQAGILFAAIDCDHELILQQIDQAFPNLELVGCTTDGEVSSVLAFQQDSIVLTLFCSDEIQIRAGVGRNISQDAIAAAQSAIAQATCNQPAHLCLAFPESLTSSGESILQSLQLALGQNFPIYGGMAGDTGKFIETRQFYKTEILQDAVPLLLFSGQNLHFAHGVASGWEPISTPGQVTQVDQNVIYEINGQSALDFYLHSSGGLEPSPDHPLAVFEPGESSFYLRGVFSHEETGSIKSFANVSPQAIVQVSTASREGVLTASKTSLLNAIDAYSGSQPDVVLVFSCNCRRRMLGTRTREEYQLIKTVLPDGIPCSGFYTYGELSPLQTQGMTRIHNMTIVTLLLGTR